MLIKQLHYSGASKMFLWVANALAERGLDITVLTYMKSEGVNPPKTVKWIDLDYLENKNIYSKYKAIRKHIKQTSPDLCISFLLDANILNIFACLNLKTKSIVCERNDPFKPGYYKLKLLKPFFVLDVQTPVRLWALCVCSRKEKPLKEKGLFRIITT